MNDQNNDYKEHEFPLNWPNSKRIAWINGRLGDPLVYSVEILRRSGKLILRVWYEDHLA